MATKTSLVWVVDAGCTMDSTKLDLAKGLISNFLTQKVITSKTFETSVVVYGSDITSNHINDNDRFQYKDVHEICPLQVVSRQALASVREVKQGSRPGDLIDGVVIGYNILKGIGKKKCNRLMVIITNGEAYLNGMDDLNSVLADMVQDADEIKYAGDEERIKNCVVNVAFIGNPASASTSLIAKENARAFEDLAHFTGGHFASGDTYEQLQTVFECRGMGTRPQQTKITLEISPTLRIPCIQWTKVSINRFPSLKKEADCYDGVDAATGKVSTDRIYLVPSLDNINAAFEDRIKGYRYGSNYVPFPDSTDVFDVKGKAGIRVIGFLPAEVVKREHFMGCAVVLQGSPTQLPAQSAIVALAAAMRNTVQVALARYVKKDDKEVALVVLLPPATEDGTLLMHRLPCTEDVRDMQFPSLSAALVSSAQSTAMANYVDALTLPAADLPPRADSALNNFYFEVERRITLSDEPLFKCPRLESVAEHPRNTTVLSALKEVFPLVPVANKQRKVKKFWSDIMASAVAPEAGAEPVSGAATEAAAAEDKSRLDPDDLNPVANFNEIVNTFGAAVAVRNNARVLEEIVDAFISEGTTAAHQNIAISCLEAYRVASVSGALFEEFNQLISHVKESFSRSHESIWALLKTKSLSLISTSEVEASPVSDADKEEFLREVAARPAALDGADAGDQGADEEDIFADME